jgi:hypothetical protein
LYLGLTIPRACLRPCQPTWAPRTRDLLRSVCSCKSCQLALDTQDVTSGMKTSLWGARLTALPSIFGCLGAIGLRPSLGRHASSGSARLFATMQDIWMSLHSIRSRSTSLCQSSSPTTYSCNAPFKNLLGILGYWALLFKASSRSAHAYKSLPEVGPARLLAAMLGDLGFSTLRSIKIMP